MSSNCQQAPSRGDRSGDLRLLDKPQPVVPTHPDFPVCPTPQGSEGIEALTSGQGLHGWQTLVPTSVTVTPPESHYLPGLRARQV